MHVLLVHSPGAGQELHGAGELRRALGDAGHQVHYCATDSGCFHDALAHETDLVVVVGGDGTVASTARQLAGRDIPLAIVPVGTANNIAHSLGLEWVTMDDLRDLRARRLPHLERRALVMGRVEAPWGTVRFVESAGLGMGSAMLRAAARRPTPPYVDAISHGRRRLFDVAETTEPFDLCIEADGVDVSGRYLMAALFASRMIGKRIAFTHDGAHRDTLQLVLVRESDRDAILQRLSATPGASILHLGLSGLPVRRVRCEWPASLGHVDDALWPPAEQWTPGARVEIGIADEPIAVVVPEVAT